MNTKFDKLHEWLEIIEIVVAVQSCFPPPISNRIKINISYDNKNSSQWKVNVVILR